MGATHMITLSSHVDGPDQWSDTYGRMMALSMELAQTTPYTCVSSTDLSTFGDEEEDEEDEIYEDDGQTLSLARIMLREVNFEEHDIDLVLHAFHNAGIILRKYK